MHKKGIYIVYVFYNDQQLILILSLKIAKTDNLWKKTSKEKKTTVGVGKKSLDIYLFFSW